MRHLPRYTLHPKLLLDAALEVDFSAENSHLTST